MNSYRAYLAKVPAGTRRHEATQALSELEPQLPKAPAPAPSPEPGEPPPTADDDDDPYDDDQPEPQPPAPRRSGERTGVVISTAAEGAVIFLDGTVQSSSPLVAATTPGDHTIRIEAPGFVTLERTVRVDAGRELALDLPLAVQPALVAVDGPDGASVYVDGKHAGDLPLSGPLRVAPGEHVLRSRRTGGAASPRRSCSAVVKPVASAPISRRRPSATLPTRPSLPASPA